MNKFIGFGVACLLATSAFSYASHVNGGNSDGKKGDNCDDHKIVTFFSDYKPSVKDCDDNHLDRDSDRDLEGKHCKIDWKEDKGDKDKCDLKDDGHKDKGDRDSDHRDDHKDGCTPPPPCSSVPAPASATLGGAGVFGVILAKIIRSRRIAKA